MFTFQGNSAPQASQAAAPSHSAFQFQIAVKPVQPFRFFDLPRELRDQIYRELLCSGKVHEPVNSVGIARRYRYQVAILRCNRQANIEATPIFYGENLFILFELGWVITNLDLKALTRPSLTLFKEEKYLVALRNKVAVNVCLSESNKFDGDKFIITPWELLTTALSISEYYRRGSLAKPPWDTMPLRYWQCVVMCNLPDKHRNQLNTITEGILALGGIRNIGIVHQHKLNDPKLSLSSMIRSHHYSIDECIAYASVLEGRGDQCMMSRDQTQGFLAYKYYYEGTRYLEGLSFIDLTGATPKKHRALNNKRSWMGLATALYMAHHEQHGPSQQWVKRFSKIILESCGSEVSAKYFFYHSCLFLQRSMVPEAMYFVWKALGVRPDWPVALGLLAEIGKRVRREPASKAKIPNAFHRLFDPTRPSGRPITEEERVQIGDVPLIEFRKTHTSTTTTGLGGLLGVMAILP
ncbi:MAG: hypothetical protein LQ346_006999 [Caloplaca aetnensis]|nr:MAG: hypothetical protein LQ346_006999 [Caloplaca aetnensis]